MHEIGPFDNQTVSGYVSYDLESNQPQRIALVNLREWNKDATTKRGKMDLGSGVKAAVVRRMSSKNGSFSHGFDLGGEDEVVTYAGQQYSWTKNRLQEPFPKQRTQQKLALQGGKVQVSVQETEAVIVEFL